MAYDEGLAQLLREALSDRDTLTERKMFGGLCFMLNGNMLCGVHAGGGMFRVGKENAQRALAIDGASPMAFTGRPMGGMVDVTDELMADEARFAEILSLALDFVSPMPPK